MHKYLLNSAPREGERVLGNQKEFDFSNLFKHAIHSQACPERQDGNYRQRPERNPLRAHRIKLRLSSSPAAMSSRRPSPLSLPLSRPQGSKMTSVRVAPTRSCSNVDIHIPLSSSLLVPPPLSKHASPRSCEIVRAECILYNAKQSNALAKAGTLCKKGTPVACLQAAQPGQLYLGTCQSRCRRPYVEMAFSGPSLVCRGNCTGTVLQAAEMKVKPPSKPGRRNRSIKVVWIKPTCCCRSWYLQKCPCCSAAKPTCTGSPR